MRGTRQGLVSIITPNYNAGQLLSETIRSVIDQTYTDWEMIVIDDCSTDNSIEILEQYHNSDPRIRYLVLPQNSGTPGVPRNRGIEEAQGEYLAFLDSDDLWHFEKLEIQINFLNRQGTDFCFSNVLPFRDASKVRKLGQLSLKEQSLSYRTLNHTRLLYKNVIKSGSSVLLRSEIVGDIRFDEDVRYRAIEDYLFWLTLHQYKIRESYWLKPYLVFYRLAGNSISKSKLWMVGQNFKVYRSYRVNGKPLGLRKYLYMATYIILSLINVVRHALVRKAKADT